MAKGPIQTAINRAQQTPGDPRTPFANVPTTPEVEYLRNNFTFNNEPGVAPLDSFNGVQQQLDAAKQRYDEEEAAAKKIRQQANRKSSSAGRAANQRSGSAGRKGGPIGRF